MRLFVLNAYKKLITMNDVGARVCVKQCTEIGE